MVSIETNGPLYNSKEEAKYIWLYSIIPFIGSSLAAAFYLLHNYIDNGGKRPNSNSGRRSEEEDKSKSTEEAKN